MNILHKQPREYARVKTGNTYLELNEESNRNWKDQNEQNKENKKKSHLGRFQGVMLNSKKE